MAKAAADINWKYLGDAVPAFLTIILMPFTYNIAYGLIGGIISYILFNTSVWAIEKATGKRISAKDKELKEPWGVKGGGHNPNVGFSSTQDGVLLSMEQNWATTRLDENNLAHVGPGSRWIDVATALDPYNRAVVSGRLGHVGAAGLTLGGGLSFLSTEYVSDRTTSRAVHRPVIHLLIELRRV